MTKEEALSKRCPFRPRTPSTEWGADVKMRCGFCIADECMLWDWLDENKKSGDCALKNKQFPVP